MPSLKSGKIGLTQIYLSPKAGELLRFPVSGASLCIGSSAQLIMYP